MSDDGEGKMSATYGAAPGAPTSGLQRRVGDRLRRIRRQKGLSLHEVERRSSQEFKASVLGAYERGERAITVARLERLADFYAVALDQLLAVGGEHSGGRTSGASIDLRDGTLGGGAPGMTIDLARLAELSEPEAVLLARFVALIQVERQDFNDVVMTLRRDDRHALAVILGTSSAELAARLAELGLSGQPVP